MGLIMVTVYRLGINSNQMMHAPDDQLTTDAKSFELVKVTEGREKKWELKLNFYSLTKLCSAVYL